MGWFMMVLSGQQHLTLLVFAFSREFFFSNEKANPYF